MRVKVFNRDDGTIVVLPIDLHGTFPPEHHGPLAELGDAVLDFACLSDEFVLALGMCGYCEARGADARTVLDCISGWTAPITDLDVATGERQGAV